VAALEVGGTHVIGGLVDVRSWLVTGLSGPHPVRGDGSTREIISDIDAFRSRPLEPAGHPYVSLDATVRHEAP
jgi:hypothetical protein